MGDTFIATGFGKDWKADGDGGFSEERRGNGAGGVAFTLKRTRKMVGAEMGKRNGDTNTAIQSRVSRDN